MKSREWDVTRTKLLPVIPALLVLVGCDDPKHPDIHVTSERLCPERMLVPMVGSCGPGKYADDCIRVAADFFCPAVTMFYWQSGANVSGRYPCSEAKQPDEIEVCQANGAMPEFLPSQNH
jgi:hypothetical protein